MTPERAAEEERAAQVYAEMLRSPDRSKFPEVNRVIIERWSVTALKRVKRRAWQIAVKP